MIAIVPHILIIDDENYTRMFLKKILKKNINCEVFEVDSGSKAIDCVKKTHFDLILLDVNMPEMNGDEVLKAIQADAKLKKIPVIIASTVNPEDIDGIFKNLDIVGFFGKLDILDKRKGRGQEKFLEMVNSCLAR